MDAIARNWLRVQENVARTAAAAGRDADEITIVAVTKTRAADAVETALAAGVTDVGENRVQEAAAKRPQVTRPARWHLIGHLQRNKAGRAIELFDLVQSVDSAPLADALARRAAAAGQHLDVLLQVNTSGASQQGGIEPDATVDLVRHVVELEHLQVRGLMTIAAFSDDTDVVRGCFRRLRHLRDRVAEEGIEGAQMRWLSMGMSGDYELAIEEGSNMVRIGTAIFGPRAA